MDLLEYESLLRKDPALQKRPRHPWERTRFSFFYQRIRESGLLEKQSLLDVGCGDAWFGRELMKLAPLDLKLTCWDDAFTESSMPPPGRQIEFVRDQPTELFDGLLMLDVLEHVLEDQTFLADVVRHNLKPGGKALISVPAWPFLFGAHDRRLQHHRRYRKQDALNRVSMAGLRILKSGGLFYTLLFPRMADNLFLHLGIKKMPHGDLAQWNGNPYVTKSLEWILRTDARLSRILSRMKIPFPGLTWWCLCQKPF